MRFWHFSGQLDAHLHEIGEKTERGYHALEVMETHLVDRLWFVGSRYSVADISLYAYTHVAHEGGFEMDRFPAINSWLARVSEQPGHVTIEAQVGELVDWPR